VSILRPVVVAGSMEVAAVASALAEMIAGRKMSRLSFAVVAAAAVFDVD